MFLVKRAYEVIDIIAQYIIEQKCPSSQNLGMMDFFEKMTTVQQETMLSVNFSHIFPFHYFLVYQSFENFCND